MAKKILVADDDQEIVMLLTNRLKANKYEVLVARDAMQAISQALEEKPDLILLDIKMPAGDGVSVFDNLRNSIKTYMIPVIFVTGFSDEKIKRWVLEKGAADFISKPFDSEELLTKIKKALGEAV